jgi:hypothetical protein
MNSFLKVNDKSNLFHRKFIGLAAQRTRAYVDEVWMIGQT